MGVLEFQSKGSGAKVFRKLAATQVMPRRRKTGTLTKSSKKANATAVANVPATIEAGKGLMAIPPTAIVEAIRISAIDEAMTQELGREDHRCRRSRFVYAVAWLPNTTTTKASV